MYLTLPSLFISDEVSYLTAVSDNILYCTCVCACLCVRMRVCVCVCVFWSANSLVSLKVLFMSVVLLYGMFPCNLS
jgi:hypothetical protein